MQPKRDMSEMSDMRPTSRTMHHVGELKVEAVAPTLEELFAEIARVIAERAGAGRARAEDAQWESVALEATDLVALLVDWANELIGRGEITCRRYDAVRNLTIDATVASAPRLVGEVRGTSVDEWISPIKAATYHGAEVQQTAEGWRAAVLFDV
jgi:SHS2 domain-containing protein